MFKEQILAKYSLMERIARKTSPGDLKPPLTLVAWSVQGKLYKDLQKKISDFLDTKNIFWKLPVTKDPHISVALTGQLNDMERDAIMRVGKNFAPIFKIKSVELLKGKNTAVDYIALKLDTPAKHEDMHKWLQDRLGKERVADYRTFLSNHVPHITLLSVQKGNKAVKGLLKELRELVPTRAFMFKPEFILLMDKFQISQWEKAA